jgi:hypothetical protein
MLEKQNNKKNPIRDFSFKIFKATAKAVIVYVIYFLLASVLAPLSGFVPGLVESIEVFVAIYIMLMIMSDITTGTVFQHFFSTAKALFFMAYLLLSVGDGIFSGAFGNSTITVNLTLFYSLAVLFSLLGLAKTILQAINFMNERAETKESLQI